MKGRGDTARALAAVVLMMWIGWTVTTVLTQQWGLLLLGQVVALVLFSVLGLAAKDQ